MEQELQTKIPSMVQDYLKNKFPEIESTPENFSYQEGTDLEGTKLVKVSFDFNNMRHDMLLDSQSGELEDDTFSYEPTTNSSPESESEDTDETDGGEKEVELEIKASPTVQNVDSSEEVDSTNSNTQDKMLEEMKAIMEQCKGYMEEAKACVTKTKSTETAKGNDKTKSVELVNSNTNNVFSKEFLKSYFEN